MTAPDIELDVGLSAGELRTHVPPDAQVQITGSGVTLERSENVV